MADEQEILDQPQVDAPTDDTGGQQPPAQQPLPEEHRKKLDSIVGQMILNKEPEDHIKAVVADFKQKYSNIPVTPPEHQITESPKPTVSTSSFFQPQSYWDKVSTQQNPDSQVPLDQLNKNVSEAHDILNKEHDKNADNVIDALTEQKSRADYMNSLQEKTSKQDATYQPPLIPARLPDQIKDERGAFKEQASTDESMQRKVLEGLATSPKTKAALYALDAKDRGYSASLINDNIEKIRNGELNYNPVSRKVEKPLGFVDSIVKGLKNHSNTIDDFNDYKSMNDAQIIAKEEARGKDFNPDIPTDKPTGLGEEIGSNAVPLAKGIGGTVAASLGPEGIAAVAPWLGAAYTSSDSYKIAYAGTFAQTYHNERIKGATPEQAIPIAKDKANFNANVAFLQNLAMAGAGLKMGGKIGGTYTASQSVKTIAKDIFVQSGIAGVSKMAENAKAGDNLFKDVDAAVGGNAAFMLTLGALHTAIQKGSNVTKAAIDKLTNEAASQPQEVIDANIGKMASTGILKPEDAQALHEKIAEVKQGSNGVPADVPTENRGKIAKLIVERTELENQMDKDHPSFVDKAYHADIKEKINGVKKETDDGKTEGKDGINEQIRKLSEPSKEPEEEIETFKKETDPIKRAKQLVDQGVIKGFTSDAAKEASKDPTEFNDFLQSVAEQYHDPESRNQTVKTYGDELTKIATDKYPEHLITDKSETNGKTNEAQTKTGQIENVEGAGKNNVTGKGTAPSVIMPEENKANKVVTYDDTPEGKIKSLEVERQSKLKEVSKPDVSLKTIDEGEPKLNRPTGKKILGKSEKGDIQYDENYEDRHEEIKTKLASLKKLVNCIWT